LIKKLVGTLLFNQFGVVLPSMVVWYWVQPLQTPCKRWEERKGVLNAEFMMFVFVFVVVGQLES